MNRKLIVSLLQKNIQELELITQGFMEMTEYPMPIILLAQRKTDDIQLYIKELSVIKDETIIDSITMYDSIEKKAVDEDENALEISIDDINNEGIEIVTAVEDDVILPEENSLINCDEVIRPETEIAVHDNVALIEELEKESDEEITSVQNVDEVETVEIEEKKNAEEITVENETPQPEKVILESTRKTILGERIIAATHTRNELLSKADNSISSTLANKKITDIKQAISIGDRFRFQRELFRANGEEMNKTLTYINQLATLEEVMSFLQSKYGWGVNNEVAEDLYQIVRRRFV